MEKFKENDFSGLSIYDIHGKSVYVTDRHQYVLPIWTTYSVKNNMSYELVSIDYHPDTNPPFWQQITLKQSMDNREEDEGYFELLLRQRLEAIDKSDYSNIVKVSDNLNNDEHINTAMAIGVLNDYHMINCMDKHEYSSGCHYLVPNEDFGLLEDRMFENIGFVVPKKPFILDIDLDYFLKLSNFQLEQDSVFSYLVKEADLITVARSVKYFNYLKEEDFSIDRCEEALIKLLSQYM